MTNDEQVERCLKAVDRLEEHVLRFMLDHNEMVKQISLLDVEVRKRFDYMRTRIHLLEGLNKSIPKVEEQIKEHQKRYDELLAIFKGQASMFKKLLKYRED